MLTLAPRPPSKRRRRDGDRHPSHRVRTQAQAQAQAADRSTRPHRYAKVLPLRTQCRVWVALLAVLAIQSTNAVAAVDDPPVLSTQLRQGASLLRQRGCLACHSVDGSPRAAPSFRGLFGSQRTVITDGKERNLIADEDYIRRSIVRPQDDVVLGFQAGQMPTPRLADGDLTAMSSVLYALAAAPPPGVSPTRAQQRGAELAAIAEGQGGSLMLLVVSLLSFVGLHFALSARRPRAVLIDRLGEMGFLGLYSAIALAALAGIVQGFRTAPYVVWWIPPAWGRFVALFAMPITLYFWVAGFSTPNPAAAGQQGLLSETEPARGILRITRHPALCGFALWALLHLLANGDRAGVLTFLSVLVLSIGGMLHIDSRRQQNGGTAWQAFSDRTSRVPFAAIVRGRNSLRLTELGLVRPLIALVLYGAILAFHRTFYGVSPLP